MSASNSEDATTLIRRSLERELGLLEMKKRLTQEEIKEFEHQYGMDSTEFIKRFEAGKLIEQFADQVNCVVLNACFSDVQAKAIAQHINYSLQRNILSLSSPKYRRH